MGWFRLRLGLHGIRRVCLRLLVAAVKQLMRKVVFVAAAVVGGGGVAGLEFQLVQFPLESLNTQLREPRYFIRVFEAH